MRDDDRRTTTPAVDRRAAQDAAAELSRMGIDPAALGLDPVPAQPPYTARHHLAPATYAESPHSWPPHRDIGPSAPPPDPASPDSPDLNSSRPSTLADAPAFSAPQAGAIPAVPAERNRRSVNGSGRLYGTPAVPAGHDAPRNVGSPAASQPWEVQTATTFISRPLTDPAAPPAPSPPSSPAWLTEPLEKVAASHRALLPPRWHRTIRAATLGLIQPGAAAAMERERQLLQRAKTRRREPAVVVFVSGKGGSGTTTTAAGIGLSLATVRTDNIALLDARRGTTSLGRRLSNKPAPTVAQLSQPEPVSSHLIPLRVRGLLGVVDAAPWHSQITHTQVMQVVDRLRDAHAFTLVDVGCDSTPTSQAVVARADQIVLVTTTSQDAIDATRIALGRIWETAPHRLNTIIVAVACLTSRQYRDILRRLRSDLGVTSRIVPIPFDPALAAGGPLDASRLSAPATEAFLHLAALVADPGPPDRDLRPAAERRRDTR